MLFRSSNLVLSCHICNQKKHNLFPQIFLSNDPERLARIQKKLKTPLHDAAAVNTTRNALFSELLKTGLPVETSTGSQTKYNRVRLSVPKTHALDAACVGDVETVYNWNRQHLAVKCTGRGSYARTKPNAYGFPRLRFSRSKYAYGFQTGDLVRVTKKAWPVSKIGRIVVRQNGGFMLDSGDRAYSATWHHCSRLQHADGYHYQPQHLLF